MENKIIKNHNLTMQNCVLTTLTGIEKVVNSSDTCINVISSEGGIVFSGKELKIEHFSIENGELTFSGRVSAIKYTAAKTPMLKKIFKKVWKKRHI